MVAQLPQPIIAITPYLPPPPRRIIIDDMRREAAKDYLDRICELFTSPPNESLWDCALRIGKIALLILPALTCCVERTLKALANAIYNFLFPEVRGPSHSQTFLFFRTLNDFDEPLSSSKRSYSIREVAYEKMIAFTQFLSSKFLSFTGQTSPNTNPAEAPEGDIALIDDVSDDILIYIGTKLSLTSLGNAQRVSKRFQVIFRSPVLWSKCLRQEDVRIWGAVEWTFRRENKNYIFSSENLLFENDPYGQLIAYSHQVSLILEFQTIARLMKGGPIAFSRIPSLEIESLCQLETKMTSSVAYGYIMPQNRPFIALKIISTDIDDPIAELLIFSNKDPIRKWVNEKNSIWEEGDLSFTNDNVLYYVKDIISGNNLTETSDFFKINRNITLYNPTSIPLKS